MTAIGQGEVGIILVSDTSRLVRSLVDWFRLLDLASTFELLIGDTGTVYDPHDSDDRLLLSSKVHAGLAAPVE